MGKNVNHVNSLSRISQLGISKAAPLMHHSLSCSVFTLSDVS